MVTLLNVVKAANDQDLYLVFDHMGERPAHPCPQPILLHRRALADLDLKRAIEGNILDDSHRRYIMYQLLDVRGSQWWW